MLVGTEADEIAVELGFTAPQHFSGHMEGGQSVILTLLFLGKPLEAVY